MIETQKSNYNPFAPLLIRIAVGFYFFLLGLWAFLEPELSTQALQRYSGFSPTLSSFYVMFACYLYFIVGTMLMAGWLTKSLALLGAILMFPLLYGAGVFTPVGDNLTYFLERRSLYRDLVVFAGCLSLTLSGGGALSLDGLLRGLYGK